MRRKDKAITDSQLLNEILSSNTICRIALVEDDVPYIVPVNYGYDGQHIYIHSAPVGKKLDLLAKNNKVCVEIEDSVEVVSADKACDFGTRFRSVICQGTMHHVALLNDKIKYLKVIMNQHTGTADWQISDAMAEKVAVLKMEISSITGKISGY